MLVRWKHSGLSLPQKWVQLAVGQHKFSNVWNALHLCSLSSVAVCSLMLAHVYPFLRRIDGLKIRPSPWQNSHADLHFIMLLSVLLKLFVGKEWFSFLEAFVLLASTCVCICSDGSVASCSVKFLFCPPITALLLSLSSLIADKMLRRSFDEYQMLTVTRIKMTRIHDIDLGMRHRPEGEGGGAVSPPACWAASPPPSCDIMMIILLHRKYAA